MVYNVYRTKVGVIVESDGVFYMPFVDDWNDFINDNYLFEKIRTLVANTDPLKNGRYLTEEELLPPIDRQEIWASGVTYYRSRDARMEESNESGGATFYDKVYNAERPELFFKASGQRTVGSRQKVNIRRDSNWNVPEPELTLFITSSGRIVGYTIGNDMSSRSIEGENPLYLPQAKVYERCAGLGPCISVTEERLGKDTRIAMEIMRGGECVFRDSIGVDQMKRDPEELVDYLYRECEFPWGCFLMTGTGMVPPREFTLQSGDEIRIIIEPIGTLINTVS